MPHVQSVRSIFGVAILLAAAAGTAACDVAVSSMHVGRERAEKTWARTYTLSGAAPVVEIQNVGGAITVEAVDGNTLDVKALLVAHGATQDDARESLKLVEIREDSSFGGVRLDARPPHSDRRRNFDVTFTVRAPRGANVILKTVNGQVTVSGAFAGLRAETTNGGVEGRGLASGVAATTTNGSIKIQMAKVGADGVSLETTNGSIDLRLPGDAKATVSAHCVNGGIAVSDLPFEKTGEGSRRKLDGAINGGGPALRLETVNGHIRVGRVS